MTAAHAPPEREREGSWGSNREGLDPPILAFILEAARNQQKLERESEQNNQSIMKSHLVLTAASHSRHYDY